MTPSPAAAVKETALYPAEGDPPDPRGRGVGLPGITSGAETLTAGPWAQVSETKTAGECGKGTHSQC